MCVYTYVTLVLVAYLFVDTEQLDSTLQSIIGDELESVRNSHFFSLNKFNTYDTIIEWLKKTETKCHPYCRLIDIGTSYEGRPLYVMQYGSSNQSKPALWVDAGIHAREWISVATALYTIDKLAKLRGRGIMLNFTVYVLPLMNPDGYHYSWTVDRMWRKNRQPNKDSGCVGVDLNRNWDFHWKRPTSVIDQCENDYSGTHPFSAPETRHVAQFLSARMPSIMGYISLHSYGQLFLIPWGYTKKLPADYDDMYLVAHKITKIVKDKHNVSYTSGSASRMLYIAPGGSDDWAKGILKTKYAYTIELGDKGKRGFLVSSNSIVKSGKVLMTVLRTLLFHIRNSYI